MLKIFEKLEYHALLEIAQTNHYFDVLARDVFRRKLSSKLIKIATPFTKGLLHPIPETRSQITLESYKYFVQSFHFFGAYIKNLELSFNPFENYALIPEERRRIHQFVEKYTAKSLISLILKGCDKNTFTYFRIPFENVESLTITGELNSIENGLKLNETFPRLRQLNLNDIEIRDSEVLNITFPYCIQFSLTISFLNDIYSTVEEFFKLNSKIEDLTFYYLNSYDYIKLASESLPHLERLQLNLGILSEEYSGARIHFDSIKTLKMDWGFYDFSDVMSFDQLESLELKCADCVDFAIQFTNLTQFHLIQREIEDADILKIGENLTKLKELSISSLSDVDERTIFELVERGNKLQKFNLKLYYENHFDALVDHFKSDWTVTMDGLAIIMEKKLNR